MGWDVVGNGVSCPVIAGLHYHRFYPLPGSMEVTKFTRHREFEILGKRG
jgi:hypothetical protein